MLFLLSLWWLSSVAQQLDAIRDRYPFSYTAAMEFIADNKDQSQRMKEQGINPLLGWSIVFPELLRYDALSDLMEVSALQTLYIQYGKDYADFSIGWFQMKPSFAEKIERKWMIFQQTWTNVVPIAFDTSGSIESRKAIVSRLNSTHGQMLYLMLFVKLMDAKKLALKNDADRVKIYAAAYNSSMDYPLPVLQQLAANSLFYLDLYDSGNTEKYCYALLAQEFWLRHNVALQHVHD